MCKRRPTPADLQPFVDHAVAVFGPRRVAVASIGDGVHVARDFRGDLQLIAMAPDTEVAHHTDRVN